MSPGVFRPLLAALFCIAWLAAEARTLAPLPLAPDLVVARDGSGDFTSIHAAVQSIPRDNRERRIILIKDGVYREQVRVDAAGITLRGMSRQGTRVEFSRAASEVVRGGERAVINLAATAHDFVLENLTVENTHGVIGVHAFAVFGLADRTVIQDCDLLSQGNDTLSLWRGRAENAAEIAAQPAAADAGIFADGGRYYHTRLLVRGSVDFICPRGWCYLSDSTIVQVNPKATAAVWHDGSHRAEKKFVLRNCRFEGPPDWYLARRHHDGHFYFIDCSFSAHLRDRAPYRVTYPLDGGTPSAEDKRRNEHYDRTNVFGDRTYYHGSRREGGDYAWHRDNLPLAPGAPTPEQITAKWTFDGTWDPERTDPPTVIGLDRKDGQLEVRFSERVTVKGTPSLRFPDGEAAAFHSGSGTRTLVFTSPRRADHARPERFDLSTGAILASEAGASLRLVPAPFPQLP